MRLWSLHPSYLDTKGLVAAWREALLAQRVLEGLTVGYRAHPQLDRFRRAANPVAAIGRFLAALYEEASIRGYRFDRSRIHADLPVQTLAVTEGQLLYEQLLLRSKLSTRAPGALFPELVSPRAHPLFDVVAGPIEPWERVRQDLVEQWPEGSGA